MHMAAGRADLVALENVIQNSDFLFNLRAYPYEKLNIQISPFKF